jgi:succinate-semialdehyde dehydrogenase/glutarate-semialdehyde dehydrogenase
MTQFISQNPFTESVVMHYPILTDAELQDQLHRTTAAQLNWRKLSIAQRADCFTKLAELITENRPQLARLASLEMGKTFHEALAEINKCTTACKYYADHTAEILRPIQSISDTGKQVTIQYEPMGVVLGIFPWNFPYWQVIRSAVPVLMAGNAMLVKPSPNVPQCALALQELFVKAGIPEDAIQTVFINETQIAALISDDRIKACTLTGSESAGAAVAARAASYIKKTVLELGGSDPFIVRSDAPVDLAVDTAITARFQNNGQSCIASKRFILHHSIADEFLHKLTKKLDELIVGNPLEAATNVGPLARKDLMHKLSQQVEKTIAQGAKLFYQHPQLPEKGFFYPPTILTHIPPHSPAYAEELFGPVISVFVVDNDSEAIAIANDTTFGLGASVWSTDLNTANKIAESLECGQVFINGLVKSHTAYPFGGVKHSGTGRELGEWGLKEFCNVKTIWK